MITGADGTVSVCGTFTSEYRATLVANQIETLDSDRTADIHLIDSPADALADIAELG